MVVDTEDDRVIDDCQYVRGGGQPVKVKSSEVCCEPLLADALTEPQANELAAAFKALADPARLRLFSLIANVPAGEACVCEMVEPLGRSQPTISHHLSILTDAGLVTREQRGRWAYFRVVPDRVAVLRDALAPPP
jgi:ArsR family transcriptional regulator, arsenate/arsenite/antimonite-responsive transcriptional repressor